LTENIEHLILDHLRALRAGQDLMRADISDVKARLLSMENYQALQHADTVRLNGRIAEIEIRLERIERRLELRDEIPA
jgi:hypothetical protein